MPRPLHSLAGLAAAAVLGASAAPAPLRHVVYGCKYSPIWRTPGHRILDFVREGQRFEVIRYSPSRRWAFGIASPGARLESHGWVRRSALCRAPRLTRTDPEILEAFRR
jgi:hypothetical protein